ncbi:hypothetical protein cypCar_00016142 [Cyprinus carpio]|nr:hypothetical protein cypCar_00016142 [Cyprinus carpio]
MLGSRCPFCKNMRTMKSLFCFASAAEALEGSRVSVSWLPGTFITQAVPVPPANYRRMSSPGFTDIFHCEDTQQSKGPFSYTDDGLNDSLDG